MAEQNEANETSPKSVYKQLNPERFRRVFARVAEVRKEGLLLTETETALADELETKIVAASRAWLNRTDGTHPAEYARLTSQGRGSNARGFAVALVIYWREGSHGMRPAELDAVCRELGEARAGISPEEIELRETEKELAREEREIAALEAEQKRAEGWRDLVKQLASPSAS